MIKHFFILVAYDSISYFCNKKKPQLPDTDIRYVNDDMCAECVSLQFAFDIDLHEMCEM